MSVLLIGFSRQTLREFSNAEVWPLPLISVVSGRQAGPFQRQSVFCRSAWRTAEIADAPKSGMRRLDASHTKVVKLELTLRVLCWGWFQNGYRRSASTTNEVRCIIRTSEASLQNDVSYMNLKQNFGVFGLGFVLKGRRSPAWANGPGNRHRDQKRPDRAGESRFWYPFRVQTHHASCPGAAFVAEATSLAPGCIPEALQAYVPAIFG